MPIIRIGMLPGEIHEINVGDTATLHTVVAYAVTYMWQNIDTDDFAVRVNGETIPEDAWRRFLLSDKDIVLLAQNSRRNKVSSMFEPQPYISPYRIDEDVLYDTEEERASDWGTISEEAAAALIDLDEDIKERYAQSSAKKLTASKRSISVPATTPQPVQQKRRAISIPQEVLEHKDDNSTIKD